MYIAYYFWQRLQVLIMIAQGTHMQMKLNGLITVCLSISLGGLSVSVRKPPQPDYESYEPHEGWTIKQPPQVLHKPHHNTCVKIHALQCHCTPIFPFLFLYLFESVFLFPATVRTPMTPPVGSSSPISQQDPSPW